MAAQFEDINPIAHVHESQQQQDYRHKHQQRPCSWQLESPSDHPHQQQPQGYEHQHAHPGIVEELGEKGAHVGEHATGHHHLLLEKETCVLKKVQFLRFP